MIEQFFNQTFRVGFAIILAVFLISIGAYTFDIALPILLFFTLVLCVITARNPTQGLFGVFLELFSNPHGHLIFWDGVSLPISLRMAVFVGFFVGYVIFLIRTKSLPNILLSTSFFLLPLLLAILLGFTNGLLFQNPMDAFKDGNAYFFLLYAIPILGHTFSSNDRKQFLQILSAGAVWNIVASFGILYLFTHFDESVLRTSYVFLRDIRLAEITNIGSGVYRVFIQSQFFVVVFGSLLVPVLLQVVYARDRLFTSISLGSVIATLILSLSRSFWIGVLLSLIVLFALLIRSKLSPSIWRQTGPYLFFSFVFSILLVVAVSFFPFPTQRLGVGDLTDAFSKRASTDVAISSRWKLLNPMRAAIGERPIVGHGFGASISFVSDDPRVREMRPDGVWTTSSMEWGWFELWLKMGILGPVSFLFLLGYLVHQLSYYLKTDHRWIVVGFISSLIFLYVTHAFSPYLNHPIGLGFLLFVLLFISPRPVHISIEERLRASVHIQTKMPKPSSVVSLQVGEE